MHHLGQGVCTFLTKDAVALPLVTAQPKNQCKTPERCRDMELPRGALSRKLGSSQQDIKPGLCSNTGKDSVYFLRGFKTHQDFGFQPPDLNPCQISSLLRTTQRVLSHSPTPEFALKTSLQFFPQHTFKCPAASCSPGGSSVSSEGIKICSTCVPSLHIHIRGSQMPEGGRGLWNSPPASCFAILLNLGKGYQD